MDAGRAGFLEYSQVPSCAQPPGTRQAVTRAPGRPSVRSPELDDDRQTAGGFMYAIAPAAA